MKIEVVHSQWAAEDEVFQGGVHDDVKVLKKTAPLFAGAAAAGSIVIHEASEKEQALLDGHVQSQEDAEAEYAKALADGRWQEGNLAQFALDVESGARDEAIAEPVVVE